MYLFKNHDYLERAQKPSNGDKGMWDQIERAFQEAIELTEYHY